MSETREKSAGAKTRAVHTIIPTNIYTIPSATEVLTLKTHTLLREIRLKRLRASKRGGRYFLLGEWLLEWLRAGEIRRPVRAGAEGVDQAEAQAQAAAS